MSIKDGFFVRLCCNDLMMMGGCGGNVDLEDIPKRENSQCCQRWIPFFDGYRSGTPFVSKFGEQVGKCTRATYIVVSIFSFIMMHTPCKSTDLSHHCTLDNQFVFMCSD